MSEFRDVPVPVDEAFDRVLPHPLPEIFRRRRLAIPPVKAVRGQSGEWGTVGQTRTIVTADGGTVLETLVSDDRPHSFGYTISDVRGYARQALEEVEGILLR